MAITRRNPSKLSTNHLSIIISKKWSCPTSSIVRPHTHLNLISYYRQPSKSPSRPPRTNHATTKQGRNAQNPRNISSSPHLLSRSSDDDKVLLLFGVCGPILPTSLPIFSFLEQNEVRFQVAPVLLTLHIGTGIDSLGLSWLRGTMERYLKHFRCSGCDSVSDGRGIRDVCDCSRKSRHRPPRSFSWSPNHRQYHKSCETFHQWAASYHTRVEMM